MGMKTPSGQKGFTLLEIMVTVSILAIALVSIFHLQTQTLSMNITTRFNTIAPFLAQRKLAELDLLPLQEVAPGSGDFGETYPGFTWKLALEDIASEELKNSRFLIKKLDLAISFNNEEMTYGMRAYRVFQE